MRRLGGSLLLGLSAATFFLTPAMEQLVRLTAARLYFIHDVPERVDYIALLGLILVIGSTAGLALWAAARAPKWARWMFNAPLWLLCVCGIEHLIHLHLARYPPLWNAVTFQTSRLGLSATDGWFIVAFGCACCIGAAFAKWPRAWTFTKPILCGGAAAVWLACGIKLVEPMPADRAPALAQVRPAHEIGPGNPVVWIVLDEWDYDLTFRRDDGKLFPEFQRLRNQSVFLDNVQAAGKVTLTAIPSLLMGRPVREYRAATAAGARFVSIGTSESFPGPRTIFDTAAQFGYKSRIVGWYHPYCRWFSGSLSNLQIESCWWDDLSLPSLRPGLPVTDRALVFLRDSVELEILPLAGPANNILRQMTRVRSMIEQASIAARGTGRTFSFLHLPVPHGPFFRLNAEGGMEALHTDLEGYQSGLDAADRALRAVRTAMEDQGVWDEAFVVVTSDHPYRYQFVGGYGNGHIPMMIKFPHQSAGVTYSHPFQAVATRNLIEDFMQGTVPTPERAVAWLERSAPANGARTVDSIPLSIAKSTRP